MADTILKDLGSVVKYGGGIIRLSECSDAGVLIGSDYTELPYLEVTERFDERDEEKVYDETGNIIKRRYGNRDVGLTATLMQVDAATLDFIMAAEFKYYTLYYKVTKTTAINGKTQELFAGIVQLKPSFRIQSGQQKIPISFTFLPNPNTTSITIATPNTLFDAVETDSVTIEAGQYYDVVEN